MIMKEYIKHIKQNNIKCSKQLTWILTNYNLNDVNSEDFFKKFGVMTDDELLAFLFNDKNGETLFRYANHENIKSYSGKSLSVLDDDTDLQFDDVHKAYEEGFNPKSR